jgi:hypothetical protein
MRSPPASWQGIRLALDSRILGGAHANGTRRPSYARTAGSRVAAEGLLTGSSRHQLAPMHHDVPDRRIFAHLLPGRLKAT